MSKIKPDSLTVQLRLFPSERCRFDAICGRHKLYHRGEFVRLAILEKMARVEAQGEREAEQMAACKGAEE